MTTEQIIWSAHRTVSWAAVVLVLILGSWLAILGACQSRGAQRSPASALDARIHCLGAPDTALCVGIDSSDLDSAYETTPAAAPPPLP